MRRILVPKLSAILQCLKTKLIHDIKVSLWQAANAVGTKCHIFQKNECWISLQHLWKTISVQTSLYDHNLAVHTEVESPCNLCDRSFKSKKKLRHHITSKHAEKEAFICDIKSDGVQCIYYSTTNSNLRAHKKRVHEIPISQNMFVTCVTTKQPKSLACTNTVNLVKNHWSQILLTTPVTCVTKRFLQKSPWTGIQSCTTKVRAKHQAVLLLVLCARKRL